MDPGQGTRRPRALVAAPGRPSVVTAPNQQPILLNCRVTTRPTITGVERWTAEVVPRVRALAPERYVVARPPPRARTRGRGQAWEQLVLPGQAARARAALIFSPANLAPIAWPRNVVVVHDAAVFRAPEAYSRAYRAWHRSLGLISARRALAVITVSEFSRRELIDAAGLNPRRLTVIGGGVDERFSAGRPDPEALHRLGLERPYVLTVATADWRKNLQALAPAAAALERLGFELVWAGDSRPYFARSARASGVRALGYVDDRDLVSLYRGARAFVLPSRYEGFGLTCLEAMACGAPVVAADRGALPETCGDAALLVDPDRPEAIADALVRAVGDEGLRDRLMEAGLARVRLYNWDAVASRVHALLRGAANGVPPAVQPGIRPSP